MTAWQSMFSAGTCNVAIAGGGGLLWSGTLTFGQSSPQIANGPTGTHFVVSVDADGVVSLITPDGANADGVQVNVLPQYDTSGLQTKLTGIAAFGAGQNAGSAFSDGAGSSVALSFDAVTGIATPSSVSFAAHAPNPNSSVSIRLNQGT